MHLLRTLHFITAFFDINLTACHLPEEVNILADALFRNNLQVFFRQCPVAKRSRPLFHRTYGMLW